MGLYQDFKTARKTSKEAKKQVKLVNINKDSVTTQEQIKQYRIQQKSAQIEAIITRTAIEKAIEQGVFDDEINQIIDNCKTIKEKKNTPPPNIVK